mmetsp:Transcript_32378/g.74889  ORF Transcript_32378/g.74889 Transcript_32378/m.74889 type:complete len:439 (-) Transcript_32378:158-1474(-)|eukprot:CAMPEP_0182573014 /NCGR_PEP_ID=MMETSP1324-20130603/18019_1 /TAXON_ID=236786 /ORGANISM="Florenciella sp., Strain RCC1587" /LENGTH=438 /DNA_ID=CAMNT_0024788055 /DNA_START=230 /DNA_END=1546 /DNA_ORIENTATION=+
MAMRMGMSVGSTTDASSLSDQVKRYKLREFKETDAGDYQQPPKGGPERPPNPAHEALTDKCIKVVVDNFAERPVHEAVPAKHMREITARLPVDMDPTVTAVYVFDENYWKRCCIERFGWQNCQIVEHGLTWKQLFFETYLQERLEGHEAEAGDDLTDLLECVTACQDYIFTLTIRELRSHLDIEQVCQLLPNLTKLDMTYGIKKCGMEYVRMMFGMKISDSNCLARCFTSAPNLTTVVLSSNLIDDDLLRMLMTGLIKNDSITHLDMSHNKITNHGVRLLSKLLGAQSVLTSLNLSDNQIHAEGGRYLGRGLRTNDTLIDLNLRLNRLTDDGGRMLLEGLRQNNTLMRLNLSSNSLGSETTGALMSVFQEPDSPLCTVDMSCNNMNSIDVISLHSSLENNRALTSIDLRMNPEVGTDADEALDSIHDIVHANELDVRN